MSLKIGQAVSPTLMAALMQRANNGSGVALQRTPDDSFAQELAIARERRAIQEGRQDQAAREQGLDIQRGRFGLEQERMGLARDQFNAQTELAQDNAKAGAAQGAWEKTKDVFSMQLAQAKSNREVLDLLRKSVEYATTVDKDSQVTPFGASPKNPADASHIEGWGKHLEALMGQAYGMLQQNGATPAELAQYASLAKQAGGGKNAPRSGATPPQSAIPQQNPGDPGLRREAFSGISGKDRNQPAMDENVLKANRAAISMLMERAPEARILQATQEGLVARLPDGSTWRWLGDRWAPEGDVQRGTQGKPTPKRTVGDSAMSAELGQVTGMPR